MCLHLSVPYSALAEVFERIDSTTKRLEIAEYLTTFLTHVIERTPGDLTKVVYLCINRVSDVLLFVEPASLQPADAWIWLDCTGLRRHRAWYRRRNAKESYRTSYGSQCGTY